MQCLHGEIFSVDKAKLDMMDKFERHPHGYLRIRVKVRVQGQFSPGPYTDGDIISCWMYVVRNFRPALLTYPRYQRYTNGVDGHVVYQPQSDDDFFFNILADDVTGLTLTPASQSHGDGDKTRQLTA